MRGYIIAFMALFCAVEAAYGAMGTSVFGTVLSNSAMQESSAISAKNHKITSVALNDFSPQVNSESSATISWEPLERHLADIFFMPVITEQEESSPEPATMLLFGSGMAGLIFITRRKFKKA